MANKLLIRKFATLPTLDETEYFLLQYPHLCCDEAATCLATECLNMEMQDVSLFAFFITLKIKSYDFSETRLGRENGGASYDLELPAGIGDAIEMSAGQSNVGSHGHEQVMVAFL